MIAKIIVHGPDRLAAIALAQEALSATEIVGVKTNLPLLQRMLAYGPWLAGDLHTGLVNDLLASQKT
ncbi:hypothetical protein [Cupriavidus numazuensis]|uniref:Biotin carboxylation domain-containing protein n=1 Tax=Cupriavidus numazuensis TaxID=221992 RepID=A0ABN7Q0U2_9BURK|nr:hypothetical protein LMG26411_02715 [Cupriavidus numazuensis]